MLSRRVMSRRPHQTKGLFAAQSRPRHLHRCSGCARCVIKDSWVSRRISIEIQLSFSDSRDMLFRMPAQEHFLSRGIRPLPIPLRMMGLKKWSRLANARRAFRMSRLGIFNAARIVENDHAVAIAEIPGRAILAAKYQIPSTPNSYSEKCSFLCANLNLILVKCQKPLAGIIVLSLSRPCSVQPSWRRPSLMRD